MSTWESFADFLDAVSYSFHLDYWADSPAKLEIWTEKDALSQILYETARQYHVKVCVTRGFLSVSNKASWGGRNVTILYFGDFDPSGLFIDEDLKVECIFKNFKRIALTEEQITKYNLPSVKVNKNNPLAKAYLKEFGDECWELDALEPSVLRQLVKEALEKHTTFNLERKREEEKGIMKKVKEFVANYSRF